VVVKNKESLSSGLGRCWPVSGSNVIPRRARPGLAGPRTHTCAPSLLWFSLRVASSADADAGVVRHPGGNPGAIFLSTPIQMPLESGGICGRLT